MLVKGAELEPRGRLNDMLLPTLVFEIQPFHDEYQNPLRVEPLLPGRIRSAPGSSARCPRSIARRSRKGLRAGRRLPSPSTCQDAPKHMMTQEHTNQERKQHTPKKCHPDMFLKLRVSLGA